MDVQLTNHMYNVLKLLHNAEYTLTGSISLISHGLIERLPEDLDIITKDKVVLYRLKSYCLDMSELITDPKHFQFLYKDSLYIDVFFRESIPVKTVKYRDLTFKIETVNNSIYYKLEEIVRRGKDKTAKHINDLRSILKNLKLQNYGSK